MRLLKELALTNSSDNHSELAPEKTEATIFKPVSWLAKINFINHLLLFDKKIIVILAEPGGGKTTFMELLKYRLQPQIKSLTVSGSSTNELLESLASQLNLPFSPNLSFVTIIDYLQAQKLQVVMMLDEAEHLDEECLYTLLNVAKQQANRSYFQICLAANQSLLGRLNKLETELGGSLIQILEPGVLSNQETKLYLEKFCLPVRKPIPVLKEKELVLFYQKTKGNIATINYQLTNFFVSSTIKKKYSFLSFGLISIFIIAAGSLFYLEHLNTNSNSMAVKAEPLLSSLYSIGQLPQAKKTLAVKTEERLVSKVAALPLQTQHLISQIANLSHSSISQALQPPPLKKVIEFNLDEDKEDNPWTQVDKVLAIPRIIASSSPQSVIAGIPKSSSQKRIAIKPTINKYTLQLLASYDEADIKRFIKKQQLKPGYKLHISTRKGKNWYILTLGDYKHLDEAKYAAEKLALKLAHFKPWIRTVSALSATG